MTCLAAFSEVWALQRKIKPHMFGHLSRSFEIWNCQLFPPGDFDETAHPNSSWKSLAISSQRIAVKSVGKMQNELKRLKPLAVAEHDEKMWKVWLMKKTMQCHGRTSPGASWCASTTAVYYRHRSSTISMRILQQADFPISARPKHQASIHGFHRSCTLLLSPP